MNHKDRFVEAISVHLSPNNFRGSALLKFIAHLCYKWRIPLNSEEMYDLFLEATTRGLESIEKTGKPIKNPEAWLKTTCKFILRDRIKYLIKHEQYVRQEKASFCQSIYPPVNAEFCERRDVLDEAMQRISSGDREIIRLRVYEGKTYEQIKELLEFKEDKNNISLACLRKRESRAMHRLREEFFLVYQGRESNLSI